MKKWGGKKKHENHIRCNERLSAVSANCFPRIVFNSDKYGRSETGSTNDSRVWPGVTKGGLSIWPIRRETVKKGEWAVAALCKSRDVSFAILCVCVLAVREYVGPVCITVRVWASSPAGVLSIKHRAACECVSCVRASVCIYDYHIAASRRRWLCLYVCMCGVSSPAGVLSNKHRAAR